MATLNIDKSNLTIMGGNLTLKKISREFGMS